MVYKTATIVTLALVALAVAACGGGSAVPAEKPTPIVSQVSPTSGGVTGGTALTITGLNFTNLGVGITEVLIGGRPATSVVVQSDQEITCATPAGIMGTVDISVTKNSGTGVMVNAFTYYPPPEILGLTENEGSRDGGLLVQVNGNDFQDSNPGQTRVLFGGVPGVNLTILDNTRIEVTTPAVPFEKTVGVEVENFNGKSLLPNSFTFRGPLPIITAVTPDSGTTDGAQVVTITGEFFTAAGGPYVVTFNGSPGYNLIRVSEQEIQVTTPASNVIGPVDVLVSNTNGSSVDAAQYTYVAPPMTVSSLTPNSGEAFVETPVQIFGNGFQKFQAGPPTVLFGTEPALNVVVKSDALIECTAPGLPSGLVDVSVTNTRGTAVLPGAFEYLWIPTWQSSFGTKYTLGDEGFATGSIAFDFEYYGETYDTCYTKANGFTNFGGQNQNYYTGAFGSYAQINNCGGDMNSVSPGGVWLNSTSSLFTITFDALYWYYTSGSITSQTQLHPSGSFALLYDSITWSTSILVGCCPAPPFSQTTVNWATDQEFDSTTAPLQSWTSGTNLVGSAVTFYPDGNDGYFTRVFTLD